MSVTDVQEAGLELARACNDTAQGGYVRTPGISGTAIQASHLQLSATMKFPLTVLPPLISAILAVTRSAAATATVADVLEQLAAAPGIATSEHESAVSAAFFRNVTV